MDISTIALLLLAPVLVWRVYSRVRSMMKRQRSILQRHYTGVLAFGAMAVVPTIHLMGEWPLLGWLAVGLAFGIGYGVWGLRLTKYETTQEGYFFTPNRHLGLVIAMQFVAALMYVGFEIYANQGTGFPTPRVTDYVFFLPSMGLVAGYFCTYSVGLLRWRRALDRAIKNAA